eukprot:scaffold24405_cov60-Phaeocystis_antarctica.AAC.2
MGEPACAVKAAYTSLAVLSPTTRTLRRIQTHAASVVAQPFGGQSARVRRTDEDVGTEQPRAY